MKLRDGYAAHDVHDLGPADMYMVRVNGPNGALEGIMWRHVLNGNECVSMIPFDMLRKPNFSATGEWPNLTITPPFRCEVDMEAGQIVNGKWVPTNAKR